MIIIIFSKIVMNIFKSEYGEVKCNSFLFTRSLTKISHKFYRNSSVIIL